MQELKTILDAGIAQLQIDLSDEQKNKLLSYLTLLQKWNKVYNLTAIRDPEEMLIKHLMDSLAIAPHIEGESLIDVGTGGGLPGIPLAICFPDKKIDLLDSNSKKTRFLIQAKAELGLINTKVLHCRVEEHLPNVLYDAVVSRAFASMQDMLDWTHHLIPEGGHWWAMKAQKDFEDLSKLSDLVTIVQVVDLDVPYLNAQRMLVKGVKRRQTENEIEAD